MRRYLWIITPLILIGAALAVYTVWRADHAQKPVNITLVGAIEKVTKIKTVRVEVPGGVKTIDKPEAIKALSLPAAVSDDKNKLILQAGEVTPYEGKTQVTAVMDSQTGETQIYQAQMPVPFVGFPNTKEIGIRYGTNGAFEGYGRWTLIRLGKIHGAVVLSADTRGEAKAQADLRYEWH